MSNSLPSVIFSIKMFIVAVSKGEGGRGQSHRPLSDKDFLWLWRAVPSESNMACPILTVFLMTLVEDSIHTISIFLHFNKGEILSLGKDGLLQGHFGFGCT